MQTLISIIIALIIFSVLVLIHEFGHFIVAKKCGVVVNEFSVGMGPRLLSRVAKSGTRYSIKALPLGGSCAMLGEDEDNAEEGSFNSKPLWARMAIVVAQVLNGDVVFKNVLFNADRFAFSFSIQIRDFRDHFAAGIAQLTRVTRIDERPACG